MIFGVYWAISRVKCNKRSGVVIGNFRHDFVRDPGIQRQVRVPVHQPDKCVLQRCAVFQRFRRSTAHHFGHDVSYLGEPLTAAYTASTTSVVNGPFMPSTEVLVKATTATSFTGS